MRVYALSLSSVYVLHIICRSICKNEQFYFWINSTPTFRWDLMLPIVGFSTNRFSRDEFVCGKSKTKPKKVYCFCRFVLVLQQDLATKHIHGRLSASLQHWLSLFCCVTCKGCKKFDTFPLHRFDAMAGLLACCFWVVGRTTTLFFSGSKISGCAGTETSCEANGKATVQDYFFS